MNHSGFAGTGVAGFFLDLRNFTRQEDHFDILKKEF